MIPIDSFIRENGQPKPSSASLRISGDLTRLDWKLDRANRPHRRKRRGAAAVEFAVIAPVFFLLVFGMIEFGRGIMVQQVLTNASREGARLAVLDGSTGADVQSAVADYVAQSTVNGATVNVTPEPSSAQFGDPVTVTVSVGFDQVSWLPTPMFLGGRTLSATTVMRRESVQ